GQPGPGERADEAEGAADVERVAAQHLRVDLAVRDVEIVADALRPSRSRSSGDDRKRHDEGERGTLGTRAAGASNHAGLTTPGGHRTRASAQQRHARLPDPAPTLHPNSIDAGRHPRAAVAPSVPLEARLPGRPGTRQAAHGAAERIDHAYVEHAGPIVADIETHGPERRIWLGAQPEARRRRSFHAHDRPDR